ncbi:testis-specific serine/threonine-protein kinase 6 isoform X1 [Octopus bimaculoides]|uniref:Protein kinase domain-containing protein n=1 Tax=Octopus bimaculoides TaxID=37653 RepID=A0A0L8GHF7_OCTBM|nr:testis-specific serine/threonine-protein kinase 6 isoform X1 [Octopus bimaculoides]|eukprot:XP_014781321.1 PREDICTED: testis-specific serine/threonine-protein kinase 6-like isoform X1 [Octopus bimaculoides]
MPSPQRKRKVTPFTTLLNFVPYKKPLNYVHSDLKQSTKSSTKSGSNQPTYRQILSDHNYSLIKSLGSGSYSKVKLAQNSNKTSLKVAVKIVNLSKAPGDFLKRFLPRELEIWPKIEHQNIIRFFDSFEDSGYVYMILEYASNGDMLTYIQKYGPIPEIQSRGIANQICQATKYLHDQNITHRDLKLENLLLDQSNSVKITDFSFAKFNSKHDLSRTYCGSKSYASPEILTGEPYDPHKADVWAIGAIMYIICTGKMPFNENRGLKKILEEQRNLVFPWFRFQLSESFQKLICCIFTYNYIKRPSIEVILENEWLKEKNSSLQSLPDNDKDL